MLGEKGNACHDAAGGAGGRPGRGRFDQKVVFITGAARGQGRAHAVAFANEGANVIACDACASIATVEYELPTAEDLASTVALIEARHRRVVAGQVDLRDGPALASFVTEAVAALGRLDVVIANAGIATFAPAGEMTDELWDTMIDINLSGVMRTVRSALPSILQGERGGAIVLVSSVAAALGSPNQLHYVAAKSGLLGMTRALANELGRHQIRVNAVLPGSVNTEMANNRTVAGLFRPDLEAPTIEDADPVMRNLNLLPVRWVEPADISNALLFLCSDEGRYITGVQLPVDAGYIAKAF